MKIYILSIEKIADCIKELGVYLGLRLSSSLYWKILNTLYGHAFDLRVKYKIFSSDN